MPCDCIQYFALLVELEYYPPHLIDRREIVDHEGVKYHVVLLLTTPVTEKDIQNLQKGVDIPRNRIKKAIVTKISDIKIDSMDNG